VIVSIHVLLANSSAACVHEVARIAFLQVLPMDLSSSHAAFDLVLAAHETVYKFIVVPLVLSKGSVLVVQGLCVGTNMCRNSA
jgi:hypothetical protein